MLSTSVTNHLNVGLCLKIEGFCHLHEKLMVIFLKYLLLAVTQHVFCESYLYGAMFFSSIDARTVHSFFLLALYLFTCDVPNKYSIMYTCMKKIDRNFQWIYR